MILLFLFQGQCKDVHIHLCGLEAVHVGHTDISDGERGEGRVKERHARHCNEASTVNEFTKVTRYTYRSNWTFPYFSRLIEDIQYKVTSYIATC